VIGGCYDVGDGCVCYGCVDVVGVYCVDCDVGCCDFGCG